MTNVLPRFDCLLRAVNLELLVRQLGKKEKCCASTLVGYFFCEVPDGLAYFYYWGTRERWFWKSEYRYASRYLNFVADVCTGSKIIQ